MLKTLHFQRIEDGRQGRVKLDIHHGPNDLEACSFGAFLKVNKKAWASVRILGGSGVLGIATKEERYVLIPPLVPRAPLSTSQP